MWQRLKKISISKWVSFLIFVLLIYGLQNAFFKLKHWLTDEQSLPLTALVLTGDRQHITHDIVREILIKQEDRLNFFTLEIAEIEKQLEKRPWVYSVSIRKRWPDTLKIHIVEQTIVATWNDKALLNRFGEIIEVLPTAQDKYIALSGEDNKTTEALNMYLKLKRLLQPTQYRIAALNNDKRNSTQLVLSNGISLRLGQEQKLERIQLFLKAFPRIAKKYDISRVEYVDLRYDTGLAVGWENIK